MKWHPVVNLHSLIGLSNIMLMKIKCSMLLSVRHAAGLGDPPSEFLNNDSNSAVKQYLEF